MSKAAFATAGHASHVLFAAIVNKCWLGLKDFNSHDSGSIVATFATEGHASPALFDTIVDDT
eukprot:10042307-Karenia_brevis.AAC.1